MSGNFGKPPHLTKFNRKERRPAVLDRHIFLGVLLVTMVIAAAVPSARDARAERAAQREMAALELGLRAAQEGRALAAV